MKKGLVIGIIAVILVIGVVFYSLDDSSEDNYNLVEYPNESNNEISSNDPPNDLALAFNVEDLIEGNIFISPFGIIRHDRDKGMGHGGIDIPLASGNPIYAVADSKIIHYEYNEDNRGGNDVHLLLKEGVRSGEGWAFLIEHLILEENLGVGSTVLRGQKIGESAITQGSNHFQFTYLFNNYEYSRDSRCWIDHLSEEEKIKFDSAFEEIKTDINHSWNFAFEDGFYPYKSLIENEDPKPCYTMGTDGRTN